MADGFNVVIDDRQLVEALDKLRLKLGDLTPVMRDIGSLMVSRVHIRFDTKTDPGGTPWTPWAESTAEQRAKEGRGTLLRYTGRMRDSLTFQASSDRVRVGFGVPYAKHHEFGTKGGKGKPRIPARPMLLKNKALAEGDQKAVLKVLREYISGTRS